MDKENSPYICPVELAGSLDNFLRRMIHKPRKILEPYISKGMTVLDLGCGPGFFTTAIAELTGEEGRVIAADLQQGMLDKVREKIKGTDLEHRVEIHKCQNETTGISKPVDFVLAFWMVHEVPDQDRLFMELRSVIKPNGRIYIIEPKFHVTLKSFETMVNRLDRLGLKIIERPKVAFSRAVLLKPDER